MRTIKVIILSLLIAPAMGLLAFGPRGGDDVPPGRVVVEYWEKWTGDEEQQMRKVVDAFNASVGREKGIFVRYISTSSINQKTLVATAAGVPPDIAGVWDSNLVQFADQDALEPLEDLAREHDITADTYKRVYWDGCSYKGHLWALVSTPAVVALHYNRHAFEENADALRGAGLDPYRAPRTLDELNAYADALTTVEASGRVIRAGYFPMEPGWYVQYTCYWFGGDLWDEQTQQLTLTNPPVIRAYEWIQRFARKYGRDAASEFRSGFGNVYSPQNPFLTGQVLMVQQGPWMANYIGNLRPELQRLKWSPREAMTKPLAERRRNFAWAAAPFPSAVPGLENVTYATFDALVIPRGARHKREAFEFIAYVNRQDVMERLCTRHCKNSPLAAVSQQFINNHPNPYIDVFETLAASPNARGAPKIPILPEVVDELNNVAQRLTLLQTDAATALREAQERLQKRYHEYAEKRSARNAGRY